MSVPKQEDVLAWARASQRTEIIALLQQLRNERDARDEGRANRVLVRLTLRYMVRENEEGKKDATT
jgi:hypothetical protein